MPAPTKTALITGASFGIGLELARIFAREGYNLVLVARSADKLRQLASELEKAHGARSLILAVDLTEPGAAAYVLDQTARADIQVDVLVNNAGFGQYGLFSENDLDGSGVTVTALCPGSTATEFHKRANSTGMNLLKFGEMDARTVAEDGYR